MCVGVCVCVWVGVRERGVLLLFFRTRTGALQILLLLSTILGTTAPGVECVSKEDPF